MNKHALYCIVLAILLCGCANGKFSLAPQNQSDDQEFLTSRDLAQKAAELKKAVKKDPGDATANFSYGRILLATNQSRTALPYLEKAVILDPGNAVYLFWQGVAYGEIKKTAKERASYERALLIDKNFVQALVYLGNNYLNTKAYQSALNYYQRALAISPTNAQALYNKAIIYRNLHQRSAEKLAWHLYLESYPTGKLANQAVDHLNRLDDFTYRNHQLGQRTVTLSAITFAPASSNLTTPARAALDQVGTAVSHLKKGKLDVLVYQKNNRDLAYKRAISIKRYLEGRFHELATERRIRLSWFDVSEVRKFAGRTTRIDESVVFFLSEFPVKNPVKSKRKTK
jgi:tetratricopeptide (TPR) repeat protein